MELSKIEEIGFSTIIKQLLSIDGTQFNHDAFSEACASFGWKNNGYDYFRTYYLGDELELYELFDEQKVDYAVIILYLWETWMDDKDLENEADQKEREKFDSAYDIALKKVNEVVDPPLFYGLSSDDYKYAGWKGNNTALLLLQWERDIQFGIEISLCLVPWDNKGDIPSFLQNWI